MNDQETNPKFLVHYVTALACIMAGLLVREPWFSGFGTAGMLAWVFRARRV